MEMLPSILEIGKIKVEKWLKVCVKWKLFSSSLYFPLNLAVWEEEESKFKSM